MITVALAALAVAWGGDVRLGVFVGADHGMDGERPLVFAISDARKMHDVFVELGDVQPSDAVLLTDAPRRRLESALEAVGARVALAHAAGDTATLVFYYSGHGDDEGLHLGTTPVSHDELRGWLEATGADVRVALLDACQSGGAVRTKGGTRGHEFHYDVGVESVRGTAVLTSSAATELSQESDEIGGGFFTHYMHTALAGAGDGDGDGDVTLQEAYDFVYTETAFHTRTAPGSQRPSFDFDLSGAGQIVLTELEQTSAWLLFDGSLPGPYAVWDETRKRYVAEVDGGVATRLAVRPGVYFVHHRMPGWVEEAQYVVRKDGAETVALADFSSVAYDDTASRGDLDREVRRSALPEMSLFVLAGARGFRKNTVYDTQYVPQHAVGGLQLRLHHRSGLTYGVDLLSGAGTRSLAFGGLGEVDVVARSGSVGAGVGWAPHLGKWLHAGVAFRGEAIVMSRSFLDQAYLPQSTLAFSPGVGLLLGADLGHVAIELALNIHVLPVQWDDNPWPTYNEGLFQLGYRF